MGIVGIVTQRASKFLDRTVQTALEIDKNVICPEPLPYFFAGHDFAWTLQQQAEHLEGLTGQPDLYIVFAHFSGAPVNLVGAELNQVGEKSELRERFLFVPPGLSGWHHRSANLSRQV